MPDYQQAWHGVQLSYEYLESAHVSPFGRAMLHTYELYHPLSGVHRFVADEVDFSATPEPDAERDPGTEVGWLAAPLTIDRPEQSSSAANPEVSLSLDKVASLMAPELDKTRGSLDSWELIERVYSTDDPSAPAVLPPMSMLVTTIAIQGSALKLTATYGDPANFSVPKTTFKRSDYPGLQR